MAKLLDYLISIAFLEQKFGEHGKWKSCEFAPILIARSSTVEDLTDFNWQELDGSGGSGRLPLDTNISNIFGGQTVPGVKLWLIMGGHGGGSVVV